jgi:hypothetical protein
MSWVEVRLTDFDSPPAHLQAVLGILAGTARLAW